MLYSWNHTSGNEPPYQLNGSVVYALRVCCRVNGVTPSGVFINILLIYAFVLDCGQPAIFIVNTISGDLRLLEIT